MEMFTLNDRAKMKIGKLADIQDWENIKITDKRLSLRNPSDTWIEAKYNGKYVFVGSMAV